MIWAIVVAAGRGNRFGGAKQFEDLADRSVLDRAMEVASEVADVVVGVLPADSTERAAARPNYRLTNGGETRSASVRAGLALVPDDVDVVVVHDAARPLATAELFRSVIAAVRAGADAAVPGLPLTDTIKVVERRGSELVVSTTLDRATLVAVQTPQAFRTASLRAAHADEDDATDDAALVEARGGRVVVVPGDPLNLKITVPADLEAARRSLQLEPRHT